jgi:hypothetical protein
MSRLRRLGVALAVMPALLAVVLAPPVLAQAPKRESAEIGDKQQDLQQAQKRLLEERQKAADDAGRVLPHQQVQRRSGADARHAPGEPGG